MIHLRTYIRPYICLFLLCGFAFDATSLFCMHECHEEMEKYASLHEVSRNCTPHTNHVCNPVHRLTHREQMVKDRFTGISDTGYTGTCIPKRAHQNENILRHPAQMALLPREHIIFHLSVLLI